MNYLKYTQYVYLVFAAFFIYDAVSKYMNAESYLLSIIIAAVCVFMFFFRRNFAKKFSRERKDQ